MSETERARERAEWRTSRLLLIALLLVASGCERTATGAPARFKHADVVRYHMRLHFDDLRSIERRLVKGKLDEAKPLAYLLAMPDKDPGMTPWSAYTRTITETALALSKSNSIDDALRLEVQIARACGQCHAEAQKASVFKPPGEPPMLEGASSTVRMTRHQWAVDRLWEGLVGNSDAHWRAGLGVLSDTPLPYVKATDAPILAKALQDRANQALRDAKATTLDDRVRVYGEMLVTCAACHSTLRAK